MKAAKLIVHILLAYLAISDLVYSIQNGLPVELAENHAIAMKPEQSIMFQMPRNFLAPTIQISENESSFKALSKPIESNSNLLESYMKAISENTGVDAIPFMEIDFDSYFSFIKSFFNQIFQFQFPNIGTSQLDNFFAQLDHNIAESGGYSLLDLDQYTL